MKRAPATITLLVLLILFYALQVGVSVSHYVETSNVDVSSAILSTLTQDQAEQWLPLGIITSETSLHNEPWRWVAAAFLHSGPLHLAFNAWALLQFGILLESMYGGAVLLASYFISAFAAGFTSSKFLLLGHYSLGASGAIFGLAGVLIVMMGRLRKVARWSRIARLQIAFWAVIMIAVGLVNPQIDNAAHAGGLLSGILIGLVVRQIPALRLRRLPQQEPSKDRAESRSAG